MIPQPTDVKCKGVTCEMKTKLYRLTLANAWGEQYVVTLPAVSLGEALSRITLDPGWHLSRFSILGVCIA